MRDSQTTYDSRDSRLPGGEQRELEREPVPACAAALSAIA